MTIELRDRGIRRLFRKPVIVTPGTTLDFKFDLKPVPGISVIVGEIVHVIDDDSIYVTPAGKISDYSNAFSYDIDSPPGLFRKEDINTEDPAGHEVGKRLIWKPSK